ncbi:MAG: P-loop-containing protein [Kiritimatiellia bacterium]
MKLAALIGEPASGKSTLALEVIKALPPGQTLAHGLLRGMLHERVAVFGSYAPLEKFPGTDRLSMAVQPHAEDYLRKNSDRDFRVFFEGDRLGNVKFLTLAKSIAETKIFVLSASLETKSIRHRARGDSQNETFLKSRATKVKNIIAAFPDAEILSNETHADFLAARDKILDFILK